MKKISFRLLVLFTAASLTTCKPGEKTDGYKSNEILVVTLDIEVDQEIEKITLRSDYGEFVDSILQKELNSDSTIKFECPHKGEGTFSLCIYTKRDTVCSNGNYAEGGYRPHLKFKNNKLEIIKGF